MSSDETLETVKRLLCEIMEMPPDFAAGITRTTTFNAELELESIELVALAERLTEHYGDRVNFVAWLSGKDLDAIIALTVGDLVEHIDACLAA